MESKKEKPIISEPGCNIFGWEPRFLQIFAGPKSFTFILCLLLAIQTIAGTGMMSGALRDIEKQFGFTSKEAGFILISSDIAALLVVPIVSFFGERGNKPKWIGYGSLLCAIGIFGTCLPKFLIGKYIPAGSNLTPRGLSCVQSNTTINYCLEGASVVDKGVYLFVFVVSQMILGAGATPLLTLGVSYIDENVDPKSSPVYMGFIYASSFIGPSAGFVIAGLFLGKFVELELPEGLKMDFRDQRWIGAWWLGFVYLAIIMIALCPIPFLFPRKLPGSSLKRKEAIEKGEIKGDNKNISVNLRGLFEATKYLVKHKIYVSAVIGVTATTVFGAGFGSAFPKFLVLKFGASTSFASIAAGIAIMPATLLGIMIGSIIMRKFPVRQSVSTAAKLCTFFSIFMMIAAGVFMIPGCQEPNIVGTVSPYQNSTGAISIDASCNSGCNCDRSLYNPGCGTDGKTYFSPCYAGCKGQPKNKAYTNCSCVPDVTKNNGSTGQHLFMGQCDRQCKNLFLFLAGVSILGALAFLRATPHKMIILREVPENQRSYALGIQLVVVRLLGFIPSPVLIGSVIDSNCILWSQSPCGKRGSCLAYQNYQFSINVAIFSCATSGVSLIAYGLAWYFHKKSASKQASKELNGFDCVVSNEAVATSL